jgi:hypothetical protein
VAALICYIQARRERRALRGRDLAAFFAFYLCALNSKEMAVTIPLAVLAYEWLYERADMRLKVAAISAVVAVPYLYGRVLGLAGIIRGGYQVQFSAQRVLDFQETAIRDLFLLPSAVGWQPVICLWAAITYLAWRRRDRPILRWCWVVMLLTPIPIEFLEGRHGAALAIPLVGWALFAGVFVTDVATALARFFDHEPGFRLVPHQARFVVILGAALCLWAWRNDWAKTASGLKEMAEAGRLTAHVIEEFRRLDPRLRSHTAVAILNDPFDGWDMYFIADLWFRDRTVEVRLMKKTPEPLDRFDVIFDYRDNTVLRLK